MAPGPEHLFERFAREGDRRGFYSLIEKYSPLVDSVCRRFLRSRQDVEDAAQETFLKLARHRENISGSLAAWLSATASATSLDLIRRTVRQRRRIIAAHEIRAAEREHRVLHEAIRA